MERTLFIVRHGKSSWDYVMDDIDRPLTERGVKNSYDMANRLADVGMVPEMILSSPANRALHTALIMARVWNIPEDKIRISRGLYLPDEEDIFNAIAGIENSVASMAIFGHNPGFTHFANGFSSRSIDNVPTAGVVVVRLEAEAWNDLINAKVSEVIFDYPKSR